MPVAPAEVWSRLRTTRSSPPGLATTTTARRRTYAAALEQFEELMQAALAVSPAARPLPLFYALSQAGRAIAAARAEESWQLSGHGLVFKTESAPLLERRTSVAGKSVASFRGVAEATGSELFEGPVTLGALCASLPELATEPQLCGKNPRALWVRAIEQSSGAVLTINAEVEAYVANLPLTVLTQDPATALTEHLRHYPTAAGWSLPQSLRRFAPQDGWDVGVVLRWRTPQEVQFPNEPDREQRIQQVAPLHLYRDRQWCRPAVAGAMLTPLMTWWALLHALSMVARYEPDTWVGLLNVDTSSLAVPLEGLLEAALEAVPHLVLEALQNRPLLLPAPV